MELMRCLLLCALVAFLPQTLGKSAKVKMEFEKNIIKDQKELYGIHIFGKFNETNIGKVSDLQSVFMDPTCKGCHTCMEQSIKAHRVHAQVNTENKINDIPNEINSPEENTTYRNKRNLDVDLDLMHVKKESKKSKPKKNKNNKYFSVTKYSDEGKTYALKVKEATTPLISTHQNQTKMPVSKCQMYKVMDSFSCDSPDADLILSERKRKINKSGNKDKEKREPSLPIEKKEIDKKPPPLLLKYHVEDSQMAENFMPSIEEMY